MNSMRIRRREANMSQESVAKALGIAQSAVSQWERGDTSPRTETLLKVASLYGCTVDELLREGGTCFAANIQCAHPDNLDFICPYRNPQNRF